MDEGKPAAAKLSKDRSPLVRIVATGSVRVGDALVSPVTAAWDHGVYIDADVTMKTQVINTVIAYFAALCQIRSVRRSLLQHALPTLIRTLVIQRHMLHHIHHQIGSV